MNTLQAPLVLGSGGALLRAQEGVSTIKNTIGKEKKEMSYLNVKLTNYIDKAHFLEGENKLYRELMESVQHLDIGIIKNSYLVEMDILKADIQKKDGELAALESEKESLAETVDYLYTQREYLKGINDEMVFAIDGLHDEVSCHKLDIDEYRKRTNEKENQLTHLKKRYDILTDQMIILTSDLQKETTERLTKAARANLLEVEYAFLADAYDIELKEYRSVTSKMKNQPEFYYTPKPELESTISQLREEYECKLQLFITDLENRHSTQLQELRLAKTTNANTVNSLDSKHFHSEKQELNRRLLENEDTISDLRNQVRSMEAKLEMMQEKIANKKVETQSEVNRLRLETEAMLKEINDLSDSKLILQFEIGVYRKLLEGVENRQNTDEMLTPVDAHQTHSENLQPKFPNLFIEKVVRKRIRKGKVSVIELDPEGKFIELGDESLTEATNMKNWTLTQTLENGKTYTHTFTDGNVFSSGKSIKIWGSKHGSGKGNIASPTVAEWASLNNPSKIILKDNNNKECCCLCIQIS